MKKNEEFYKKFVPAANFKTYYTLGSAHGFVSDYSNFSKRISFCYLHHKVTNNFGAPCGSINSANYLNNCNYNQAYDLLKHMYNLQTPEHDKNLAYKETVILLKYYLKCFCYK